MLCRAFATTSTSSSQQRPDQQQSPSSSTTTAPAKLDWNTFFTLRASRRRYSLISSIIAALGTTSAGLTVLLTQNLEVIGAQMMGLDPIAVMVLGTAACGAVGWLAGPFVGTGLWRWRYRNQKDAVAVVSPSSIGIGLDGSC
jgi:import inner membrane translocase subunit TIM23